VGIHHFEEDAVNAVADGELLFGRLDVDVGGAFLDGVEDEVVDEADDGGLASHLGEVQVVLRRGHNLDVVFLDAGDDLVDLDVAGFLLLEGFGDSGEIGAADNDGLNGQAEFVAELVEEGEVVGLDHAQKQAGA